MSQRMLLSTLSFECGIPYQVKHSILWWWQNTKHFRPDISDQCHLIPVAAPHHPHQCPVLDPLGHQAAQFFQCPFIGIHQKHYQQPAEEHEMASLSATEMALERKEKIVYFLRYTCKAKHVALLGLLFSLRFKLNQWMASFSKICHSDSRVFLLTRHF